MHADKVPEVVVSRLSLRNLVVRLSLSSVNHVGELYSILDEENGYVVSDKIPVTLLGVELDSKSTDITDSVRRTPAAQDSRETEEDRGLAGGVGEDASAGNILGGLVELEGAKGTSATGVDNTLGDSFVVKAVDLELVR